jgi:hypothetical protein
VSLESTLGVVRKSLSTDELKRWPLAEHIYAQHGSPAKDEREPLMAALKEITERCYIAVVYKFYKRIERREWPPKPVQAPAVPVPTDEQLVFRAMQSYPPEQFARWLAMHQAARVAEPQSVIPIEKGRRVG